MTNYVVSEFNEEFGYRKQNYFETYIVLGYKIDDKNYLALNLLITVAGFYIYKSYYITEQKTKYILYIDVYRIFANGYIKIINENKTLQKCTFLMKVKDYIINGK